MSTVVMSGPRRNTDVCQSVVPRQGRFKNIRSEVFRRDGHHEMLLRELEINTLLPFFLRSHVLNTEELRVIRKQKIRRRRVGEFLEIMFKRDTDEWIDTVLLILEENDHSHIVKQLQGLCEPLPPYQIRSFRPTQFQFRVLPDEHDMVRALQADQDSQILEDAVETLEFSILNIYEGSLCFLLDPNSEKAIEELWKKSKNVSKIKKFLGRILARLKTKQNFLEKRMLNVEISEIENNFLIHINDNSGRTESFTFVEKKSSHCSGCFRKTVLGNYQSILDEVETSMMEETFKADIVPGCIKTACIDEKYKRSRLERADIFMQFALTNEKLLMAFKSIYEKSSVEPTRMYCGRHSYKVSKELVKPRETIRLCFEIDCDEKDGTIVITSTNDEFRKSWPCLDPINEISMPFCHIEIENSSNSGKTYERFIVLNVLNI
ncbi:Hypothetical predicted protein [Mytilus galloprovincialis]|uniref:CARD domain-containing protein n=1 Tax=Mytilus galloprovincialis TaxID=29158 RepID=A0A8B6HT35_MYTGA|nr:Hypothetical predicted protein [Mytilus galloprovincialis]VDI83836.1 Hypothetical predicted protein [Mytilus galloprovincialis]